MCGRVEGTATRMVGLDAIPGAATRGLRPASALQSPGQERVAGAVGLRGVRCGRECKHAWAPSATQAFASNRLGHGVADLDLGASSREYVLLDVLAGEIRGS